MAGRSYPIGPEFERRVVLHSLEPSTWISLVGRCSFLLGRPPSRCYVSCWYSSCLNSIYIHEAFPCNYILIEALRTSLIPVTRGLWKTVPLYPTNTCPDMMQTFRNRKMRTLKTQMHATILVDYSRFSWLFPEKNAQEAKALILFFDTLPRSAHALACWEYGARPLSSW